MFKRIANTPTTLELYPKHIYFLKTNKDGLIVDESFRIVQGSIKTKLQELH